MSEIKPKIDDQFWFDMSEDMVKGGLTRLDQAIDRLRTLLLWAYGIYAASSIFTIEFKNLTEPYILVILASPYIFLLLAYWQTHVGQNPVSVNFDPRSPDLIRNAYLESYKKKRSSLNLSVFLSFLGITILSLALMAAFILKNEKKDEPYIKERVQKNGTTNEVYLTGYFPKDSLLTIILEKIYIGKSNSDSIVRADESVLNSSVGIIYLRYSLDSLVHHLSVSIQWNENNYTKTLKRIIKL
jgi:hypothetical protein